MSEHCTTTNTRIEVCCKQESVTESLDKHRRLTRCRGSRVTERQCHPELATLGLETIKWHEVNGLYMCTRSVSSMEMFCSACRTSSWRGVVSLAGDAPLEPPRIFSANWTMSDSLAVEATSEVLGGPFAPSAASASAAKEVPSGRLLEALLSLKLPRSDRRRLAQRSRTSREAATKPGTAAACRTSSTSSCTSHWKPRYLRFET